MDMSFLYTCWHPAGQSNVTTMLLHLGRNRFYACFSIYYMLFSFLGGGGGCKLVGLYIQCLYGKLTKRSLFGLFVNGKTI